MGSRRQPIERCSPIFRILWPRYFGGYFLWRGTPDPSPSHKL